MNYEVVESALDKIACLFVGEDGCISTTRLSEVSSSINKVVLHIENEMKVFLDALNICNHVELVETYRKPDCVAYALCVSFYIDGELRTYNIPVYAQ